MQAPVLFLCHRVIAPHMLSFVVTKVELHHCMDFSCAHQVAGLWLNSIVSSFCPRCYLQVICKSADCVVASD